MYSASSRGTRIEVVTDGSQPAFQNLMDDIQGETEPVVILIPPGAWEMVGTVTLAQDNVTILGAGPEKTLFYRNHEENTPIFQIEGVDNVRWSGLSISGNSDPSSASSEYGIRFNNVTGFRVDDCAFYFSGFAGVRTSGESTGVVDHCSFEDIYKPGIANLGYGVVVYGSGTIENEPYGSDRATFIEDSFFSGCRHAVASNNGARYVFRYNEVASNEVSHAIDAHGHEYGSQVTTEWIDVYRNTVTDPVYQGYAVRIRGGGGLIWENTFDGYDTAVALTENTDNDTGPVYIWSNTLVPGTTTLVSAPVDTSPSPPSDGVPEYETSALSGYTPYIYPHALVTDLQAKAGWDMEVMLGQGETEAEVYLDASESTALEGVISSYRWYLGSTLVSDCARDVVSLSQGIHLLVCEVERNDGLLEHDMVVVHVIPHAGHQSTEGWNSLWFVPLVGAGEATFTLTPSMANMDGYVALTGRHPVSSHEHNAIIVRTNNTGVFDVRNGDSYEADAVIPYTSGQAYDISLSIDLANEQYSVWVDGQSLAASYGFRLSENSIGQLTAWHSSGFLEVEDLEVTGLLAQPDVACQDTPIHDASVPDGSSIDAQIPLDGGTGDGSMDGASTLDASAPSDAGNEPPSSMSGGCGCVTATHPRPCSLTFLACLFLSLLFVFKRGRRRRS